MFFMALDVRLSRFSFLYWLIWSYSYKFRQYSLKNIFYLNYHQKNFLISKTATKTVKTMDRCSHRSGVTFGGKFSSARISSHLLNGTFFCFLFSFICLRNWPPLTDSEHCLTEWIKHDSAPWHLLSFVLEVALPCNPKMHLDITLNDVNRYLTIILWNRGE